VVVVVVVVVGAGTVVVGAGVVVVGLLGAGVGAGEPEVTGAPDRVPPGVAVAAGSVVSVVSVGSVDPVDPVRPVLPGTAAGAPAPVVVAVVDGAAAAAGRWDLARRVPWSDDSWWPRVTSS